MAAAQPDYDERFRIFDASPLASVPRETPYISQTSYDDGVTWDDPHPSTAEHAHHAAADAEWKGRRSETTTAGVVTVQVVAGYLVRFTPAD